MKTIKKDYKNKLEINIEIYVIKINYKKRIWKNYI